MKGFTVQRLPLLVVSVLLVSASLSGCQEEPQKRFTPAPVQEVVQVAEIKASLPVGTIVPTAPGNLALGEKAFPLPDGTLIIVDSAQPLPSQVSDLIQERVNAITGSLPPLSASDLYLQLTSLESSVNSMLNKNLQVVYRLPSSESCNGLSDPWTFIGAHNEHFGTCPQWASKEEALAAARWWIDERHDKELWILLSQQ